MRLNKLVIFLLLATFSSPLFGFACNSYASDAIDIKKIKALQIKGDREFGEYLASECKGCHQLNASNQEIPVIAGRSVKDFIVALNSFKIKARRSPVMEMVANRLTDEEIAALAAYFSTLK